MVARVWWRGGGGPSAISRASPGAGATVSGGRFEELVSAERVLIVARWVGVVFGLVQVATYGALPYPAGARELAFGLVAVLAVTNVAAAVAVRRVATVPGAGGLAVATLAMDTLVVAALVWSYAFDGGSVHFLLFFVLPAEAALKFRLSGAMAVWCLLTASYTARQAWAADRYGFDFGAPSIVFRMGMLFIVSLIVGLFAQKVWRRTNELAHALERLEQEERWRSGLIDMLAHDFRDPVGTATSAMLLVEDLLPDTSTSDMRRLVESAVRQNRRGLALADEILTLARAGQDRLELNPEVVELAPMLERMVGDPDPGSGWVTTIDVAPDLRPVVDPLRLEQIVSNLLSNARRHGRSPVDLSARPFGDGGVEVRVSDGGDGVPDVYQDSLFTQFARGPRSDSVGLGLWLVAVLAEMHGGGARYETVDGRPTFVVTLSGQAAPVQPSST